MKPAARVRLGDVCHISSALFDPRQTPYRKMPHVGGANIETMTGELIHLKTAGKNKWFLIPDTFSYSCPWPMARAG
jgi:hypothetical protein